MNPYLGEAMTTRWIFYLVMFLLWGCSDPVSPLNARPKVLWQVPYQLATTAPLVIKGLVILGTADGYAVALDQESGQTRWKRKLADTKVHGSEIRSANGLAIVPQYEVWALDPTTGGVRWRYGGPDGTAGVHDVATSGDTVFTGSAYGWASAVNATTGAPFWSVDLGESAFDPSVTDDLVIYGTRNFLGEGREGPLGPGHLVALLRSDGSEAWRFVLPNRGTHLGGAVNGGVAWGDRVIVGSMAGDIYAVSLSTGEMLWHHAGANFHSLPPVILDDVVVFSEGNLDVLALDVATGEWKWGWERPTTITRPLATGPYVYFIDGPIEIADSGGNVVWRYGGLGNNTLGLSFWRAMVSDSGVIYTLGTEHLGTSSGLYAFALRPPVRP